ncbi:hypothetical protein Tco_1485847 [Tanacetum coccineum]
MSSPNHLTSGIEDAFSSNFPDFIPASSYYVPASPGKTYSSSSNLFGVVPIASPTLSLFHFWRPIQVLPAPETAKHLTPKCIRKLIKHHASLAIPDEYLFKFHNVPDANSLWAAIKSRFGGNDESKKMQRNVLKHQFENFTTAPNESLDKAYDRFQKLISQLEVHVAPVSKEDINQKFLRSLPPTIITSTGGSRWSRRL